ncbi:hypothetical protein [Massilia sp. TS11]|uniref:hypothetical protein n=1 Tax=Massilia sp. TS11 TaxID=2908003 RepID=UPI001EDAA450|nr:hypothetical protein [Massilia sp. TS11]MCG2583614.1 hypothetical protein [Massilia sp. TS11]
MKPGALGLGSRCALLAAGALLLALSVLNQQWTQSFDFAHHYSLVARIAEHWTLHPLSHVEYTDPGLGEMNIYPRLSHQLAAVLGRLLGSPLLGMHLTALLSLAVLWGALASSLATLPRRASLLAAAALLLGGAGLHYGLGLPLHGEELVGNYFYAQLVGHAAALALLVLDLAAERRAAAPVGRRLLLLAGMYLVASIHLLPAAEVLAYLAAQSLLEALRTGGWRARSLVIGLWPGLAGALLLRSHHSYWAMGKIAANDGVLNTPWFQHSWAFGLYVLVLALLGCALLSAWWRQQGAAWPALKLAGLYALAVAGIAGLQFLLFMTGHSNLYALKKHAFALHGAMLFAISLGLAWGLARAAAHPARGFLLQGLLPVLLMVALARMALPLQPGAPMAPLVALEHQLQLRHDLQLPPSDKPTYVLRLDGQTPITHYLFSLGIFHIPRDAMSIVLVEDRLPSDWSALSSVLTSEHSELDRDPACRRAPPANELVVLDASCVGAALGRPAHDLSFQRKGLANNCTLEHFSGREDHGSWSDGRSASLRCPLPARPGPALRSVDLEVAGFVTPAWPRQRVQITVIGGASQTLVLDLAHPVQTVRLALPAAAQDSLSLRFEFPDAQSPQALGQSPDARLLAMALRRMTFQ